MLRAFTSLDEAPSARSIAGLCGQKERHWFKHSTWENPAATEAPTSPKHSWEGSSVKRELWPLLLNAQQALMRFRSGLLGSLPFSANSEPFRILLLGRFTGVTHPLDSRGHQSAVCAVAEVSERQEWALESTLALICGEAAHECVNERDAQGSVRWTHAG